MASINRIIRKVILLLIPKVLKKLIESEYKNNDINKFQNLSFAQEGEDLVLSRFMENRSFGFFVDVGAHHPVRFSNTYKFYLKGWSGINIDAMPGSMEMFNELRPKDINIEVPISEKSEMLTYHIFNEPALNTFSLVEANKKDGIGSFKIIEKRMLLAQRLETILDNHLPNSKHIDFLTIDVEGLDFVVLKSNNWEKYKPEFVLIEDLGSDIERVQSSELYSFMKLKGYKLVARTFNTLFFNLK